jgi:hypothetical protein
VTRLTLGRHRRPIHLAEGLTARDEKVEAASTGTRVTLGLTSRCPYGLAACWGGAYQTLKTLDGVAVVKAVANAKDSTAELFLSTNGLPNLDVWQRQFSAMAKHACPVDGGCDFKITLQDKGFEVYFLVAP